VRLRIEPARARALLALGVILFFVVQTSYFVTLIWHNRDHVRIEDLLNGPMCGQMTRQPQR
jgi:hypothetical protein